MMKRFSHSPIIILLDLLFVFLFVLVQQDNRSIEINIPTDHLFKGAEIFRKEEQEYISINYPNKNDYETSQMLDCKEQLECQEARRIYGDKISIYIPPDLVAVMSEMTFFSFKSDSAHCKNIKFYISSNGELDMDRIFEENPCMRKIPLFAKYYKHQ